MASHKDDMLAGSYGARSPELDGPAIRLALSEAAPAVRRYVFGMCGCWDLAEDLAQDALLKAWSKRGSFDGQAKLRTWIFSIARNHWLDSLRRKHARPLEQPMPPQPLQAAASPAPQATAEWTELSEAIDSAMNRLPDEQREALALRESDGLTFSQIAKVLGISAATVKSRVRYALKKLSADLKQFERYLES